MPVKIKQIIMHIVNDEQYENLDTAESHKLDFQVLTLLATAVYFTFPKKPNGVPDISGTNVRSTAQPL